MLGHHQHASEMLFKWRFAYSFDDPLIVVFWSSPHQHKKPFQSWTPSNKTFWICTSALWLSHVLSWVRCGAWLYQILIPDGCLLSYLHFLNNLELLKNYFVMLWIKFKFEKKQRAIPPKLCKREIRILYTALLLIEIYLQWSFKLIPLIVSVSYSGQNIRKFSETPRPTENKFHVAPPWDGEKMESLFKWFRSFVGIRYCWPPGKGVFSRALKTEKLKAPLFPGPRGRGIQKTGTLCLVFVLVYCLFLAAIWLPAGKGLASWFSCVLRFLLFLSISHYVYWSTSELRMKLF